MNPKVTVLIPVFNREQFVDEAIRSVVEQDYEDFELLLVDDGSTDGTPDVLAKWKQRDPRVVVVTAPSNLGIPGALNLGLAHARGTYVARLDSDDLMMPRRLAEQVAVLDAHPEVVLVSCAYDVIDAAGNYLLTRKCDEPPEVKALLIHFFNVIGGGPMYRLAEVLEEGGYAREYPISEDFDLFARLLRRGRIETLPFIGMIKRAHATQSVTVYGWDARRANWNGILRSNLGPYLRRDVRDDEIAALITVWQHDRRLGVGAVADAVMREAFVRFRSEVSDRALQKSARRRIARQWYINARVFASYRHYLEAAKYLARAAGWLLI